MAWKKELRFKNEEKKVGLNLSNYSEVVLEGVNAFFAWSFGSLEKKSWKSYLKSFIPVGLHEFHPMPHNI